MLPQRRMPFTRARTDYVRKGMAIQAFVKPVQCVSFCGQEEHYYGKNWTRMSPLPEIKEPAQGAGWP